MKSPPPHTPGIYFNHSDGRWLPVSELEVEREGWCYVTTPEGMFHTTFADVRITPPAPAEDHTPPTGFSDPLFDALKAAQRFDMLTKHPHLRAEVIANHYASLAMMAVDLHSMVELRKTIGEPVDNLDEVIDTLVSKFTDYHMRDFGIELAWRTPEM